MRSTAIILATLSLSATAAALAPSSPIIIDSRDDWLRLGLPGNGTAEAPFLLENLTFDLRRTPSETALAITDVPDHAIVRNVFVLGGKKGLVLHDAPNVSVENVSVRRTSIAGFDVVNGSMFRVTAADNPVGIIGLNITLRNSFVYGNSEGVKANFTNISDSLFLRNSRGLDVLEGASRRSWVERTEFSGSQDAGVAASAPIRIVKSTFDGNSVGFRFIGKSNTGSIAESNFGSHEFAAVVAVPLAEPPWELSVESSFWGYDGPLSTEPSPFGRGSPVQGPIDFDPIAPTPIANATPRGPVGAEFPGNAPPVITNSGSLVFEAGELNRADVLLKLEDADGIASWEMKVGAQQLSIREELFPASVDVARSFDLPKGDKTAEVVVTAYDIYGTPTRFNMTAIIAPPPPPPEEPLVNETTVPEPANDSPSSGWVAGVITLALAGLIRKRRGRGQ